MNTDQLAEILCAFGHIATRKRGRLRANTPHLACPFHLGLAVHITNTLQPEEAPHG